MYRGIRNDSFGTSSAQAQRNSVRFGENFSDGAILEVILLESHSKSSHLGCREPQNRTHLKQTTAVVGVIVNLSMVTTVVTSTTQSIRVGPVRQ